MFSVYHIVWLVICAAVCSTAVCLLRKYRPALKNVLSVACVGAVASELIKTFSVLEMVPSSSSGTMHVYLEMQHLPLHLCSIQIIFIFYSRFARESKAKETLLAFMYPSCTLGAFFAVLLPSIFSSTVEVTQAFTHPLCYQYFLYHSMLIILGLYIPMSKAVDIRPKHYFTSLGILGGLAFLSLYLNSMFASPTYVDGELVSVDYTANFFFTYKTPIGLQLTELWQWYVYLGVIVALAVILIGIFYLPFIIKAHKNKQKQI